MSNVTCCSPDCEDIRDKGRTPRPSGSGESVAVPACAGRQWSHSDWLFLSGIQHHGAAGWRRCHDPASASVRCPGLLGLRHRRYCLCLIYIVCKQPRSLSNSYSLLSIIRKYPNLQFLSTNQKHLYLLEDGFNHITVPLKIIGTLGKWQQFLHKRY